MRHVLDERTNVLVGNWNVAILNPNWIATQLFEVAGVEAQIMISGGQTNLRYRHNDILVAPEPNRIVISQTADTNECLQQASAVSIRLLELLPVTPVTAVGMNFGYIEDEIPAPIAEMFNTFDIAEFATKRLTANQMNLIRHFPYDGGELRLRITIDPPNSVRAHFNFHRPIADTGEGINALRDKAANYRQFAEEIIRDVYELGVEANDDE